MGAEGLRLWSRLKREKDEMKSLAIALVIIGIAVIVFGMVSYANNTTTLDMGSMSATITEHGAAPMAAMIVGGISLISGLVLLTYRRRHA